MIDLYPCPYCSATECTMEEGCAGCETFGKHRIGSMDKAHARDMRVIERKFRFKLNNIECPFDNPESINTTKEE